ncbi:MAG: LON peptidase substrate-binding domain-containing protein [Candidatus Sericytochromatia bacterium]|nr:LON peptidase substrate-binding domain-containing protein [Candidatus Sericytochromatia bacterium]
MSEMEIPVFPLSLVLYPGMTLPLHIFEARYKQLIADVHGVGGVFGIVLVEPDADDAEGARLHTVGALARITQLEPLPDGRYNLVVQGERRMRLLDWQEEHVYATAHVQLLDEDLGSDILAGLVRARFGEYNDILFTLVQMAAPTLPDGATAVELSYWVASNMHLEWAEKQFLLRCESTDERLSSLLQLLAREIQKVSMFSEQALQQGKQFIGGVPFSVN